MTHKEVAKDKNFFVDTFQMIFIKKKNPYKKAQISWELSQKNNYHLKKEVTHTPDRKALTGVIPIVMFFVCFFCCALSNEKPKCQGPNP